MAEYAPWKSRECDEPHWNTTGDDKVQADRVRLARIMWQAGY